MLAPPTSAGYAQPRQLIAGHWRDGAGELELQVVNPAAARVISRYRAASANDIEEALRSSARGFARWAATPAIERGRSLREAARLLRARIDTIAHSITLEEGKPLAEAMSETRSAADILDWYAEECRRTYGRIIPARTPGALHYVLREPAGPAAAFTPWNFPILTPARKIGGALAAGCSCIIKPSEQTPAGAIALVQACIDAGVPEHVLNLLLGDPEQIATTLICSAEIRKISFTGSTEVGRRLMQLAGFRLKRTTMELGGHAPVIVFGDVDIEAVAAAAVTAKFRNAGQICVSPTRFFVHRSVFDRFVQAFCARAAQIKIGDGLRPDVEMGPLANARRLEAIERLTDDALSHGAHALTGASRLAGQGYFYTPTVLVNTRPEAQILRTEPFGPVVPVVPFDDGEEAASLANALPFGLAAYLFTQTLDVANAMVRKIEAGMIGLNQFQVSLPEAPFGGVKDSGHGSEGGIEGLDAYLTTKLVNSIGT